MQGHLPEFDLLVPRTPAVLLELVGGLGVNAGLPKVPAGEQGYPGTQPGDEPNSAGSAAKTVRVGVLQMSKVRAKRAPPPSLSGPSVVCAPGSAAEPHSFRGSDVPPKACVREGAGSESCLDTRSCSWRPQRDPELEGHLSPTVFLMTTSIRQL